MQKITDGVNKNLVCHRSPLFELKVGSGLLDAFTSYGTYLYWPFYDERVAWSIISIIDPVFSGTLIIALIIALTRRSVMATRIGSGLCALYLVISFTQSKTAYEAMTKLADSRSHEVERYVVKPTFGNILLWRTVYLHDGRYYIDAINTAFNNRIYAGASIPALAIERDFPRLDPASQQYQDIQRFDYFSDGFGPENGSYGWYYKLHGFYWPGLSI